MITEIIFFILGLVLCVEAIALLVYPKKIKKLVNILFRHRVYLHIIATVELVLGLTLIFVIFL